MIIKAEVGTLLPNLDGIHGADRGFFHAGLAAEAFVVVGAGEKRSGLLHPCEVRCFLQDQKIFPLEDRLVFPNPAAVAVGLAHRRVSGVEAVSRSADVGDADVVRQVAVQVVPDLRLTEGGIQLYAGGHGFCVDAGVRPACADHIDGGGSKLGGGMVRRRFCRGGLCRAVRRRFRRTVRIRRNAFIRHASRKHGGQYGLQLSLDGHGSGFLMFPAVIAASVIADGQFVILFHGIIPSLCCGTFGYGGPELLFSDLPRR